MGPTPINIDYGYKYYISSTDVYSRYVWIYFLKSKFDTCNAVVHYMTHVGKQIGNKIKILQNDGGREFQPLKDLFMKWEYYTGQRVHIH